MKQLHLNDPSTLAKKHQGETNQRLDAILDELRTMNQRLAQLLAAPEVPSHEHELFRPPGRR